MESIGEKIRRIRKSKGISQMTVADTCNIKQSSYANIESGKTQNITIEIGKGIAKALNVSFNELFEIDFYSADWQKKTEEDITKLWNTLKEKNKLIEQKDLLIDMLQKEKEMFKSSVIQSISNHWDLRILEIENEIKSAASEKEKEVLMNKKNHALRNKDFTINNFISIGFLKQEDIDNYYKSLREDYESLIKNQVR